MSLVETPSTTMFGRNDQDESAPVGFRSGRLGAVRTGGGALTESAAPSTYTDSVSGAPDPRRRVARVYLERVVDEYVIEAMRHARTRQFPDGYWIADVIGLEGAWADGETREAALGALPDIIFDWAMLKIADHDGDIPPLGEIDLNEY